LLLMKPFFWQKEERREGHTIFRSTLEHNSEKRHAQLTCDQSITPSFVFGILSTGELATS